MGAAKISVEDLGFKDLGRRAWDSGFGVQDLGFRVWGWGLGGQDVGFKVPKGFREDRSFKEPMVSLKIPFCLLVRSL